VNWLWRIYGPWAVSCHGLVTSVKGEPTPERGGRAKVYYELTPEGKAALKKIQEVSAAIWQGAPKIEA
jgi:DNA-binding PadR family transcriptional regulator